ncbi:53_t:CDS:2 [Paraglomus brasilianum]|uniref:53_t:CDS:1 n=1 Tax=Paraglomus brasilianum TaxID=144538 RepID=A0A9N9D0W9_9GLOM|nr:53_t:CDS:2 [Paraglomus brasilianum]
MADSTKEQMIIDIFKDFRNQTVLFTNANMDKNVKKIIDFAADKAKQDSMRYPFVTVLVVGMPNVGKSSLINSMRRLGVHKGKAAKTGAMPGVTRSVEGTIKVFENPTVYLIDTPGVMIPYIADPISSLKVALTGGVKDDVADKEIMADYLLWRLNHFSNFSYVDFFHLPEPTDDITVLLPAIARRIGALQKGREYDLDQAATFFLKYYRTGKFGRYTLDDVTPDILQKYLLTPRTDALSKNQEKKSEKERKKEKRLEKWRRMGIVVKK